MGVIEGRYFAIKKEPKGGGQEKKGRKLSLPWLLRRDEFLAFKSTFDLT